MIVVMTSCAIMKELVENLFDKQKESKKCAIFA